jgi:hypothetical protein
MSICQRPTLEQSGNQTEARLAAVAPTELKGCSGFLYGRLIGTVTGFCSMGLAWIGMMLVDPDYRHRPRHPADGQGFEHLRRIKVASIKLMPRQPPAVI